MLLHKPVVRVRETRYKEDEKPGRRVGPVSGSGREALALRWGSASSSLIAGSSCTGRAAYDRAVDLANLWPQYLKAFGLSVPSKMRRLEMHLMQQNNIEKQMCLPLISLGTISGR